MTSRKIGVAVVGTGYWGRKLVGEYLALSKMRDDFRLVKIADASKERVAAVGNEFGLSGKMLEVRVSDITEDINIDAVHLATPNETHFKIGMEILESGKHLLLEKPMAMHARDALKLARTAEEKFLVLHVGHVFRFNNALREARRLLEKGFVGKPLSFTLMWKALTEPPAQRDIIFDLGPHPVDILNFLSQEWPTRVLALGKSYQRRKKGCEEVASAILEFENDMYSEISLSWLYYGPKMRTVSITGEKGGIEIDTLKQEVSVFRDKSVSKQPVHPNNTIESMINHFLNNILGKEAAQNSALVGATVVSVLGAMRESMNAGRFIPVLGGPRSAST
jgi:predicted dehydrogenase